MGFVSKFEDERDRYQAAAPRGKCSPVGWAQAESPQPPKPESVSVYVGTGYYAGSGEVEFEANPGNRISKQVGARYYRSLKAVADELVDKVQRVPGATARCSAIRWLNGSWRCTVTYDGTACRFCYWVYTKPLPEGVHWNKFRKH
jgi:hypothetical protein